MAQYQLTWDSYKKAISDGFSYLQQLEEFVDMTLAVQGHLVKVHKTMMALASPYLKAVIQSAPCPHPVVFLMHITHEMLTYIIEFVYTGEVVVPTDKINEFIEAAKALNIGGLHDLAPLTKNIRKPENSDTNTMQMPENDTNFENLTDNKIEHISTTDIYSKTEQFFSKNRITKNLTHSRMDHLLTPGVNSKTEKSSSQNETSTYTSQYKNFIIKTSNQNLIETTLPGSNNSIIGSTVSNFNTNQAKQISDQTANKYIAQVDTVSKDKHEECECDVEANSSSYENTDIEDCGEMLQDIPYNLNTHSEQNPSKTACKSAVKDRKPCLKNYSINVEMPTGSKGPPKITIDSGAIDNLSSNIMQIDDDIDGVARDKSTNVPKISINSGSKTLSGMPSINVVVGTAMKSSPVKSKDDGDDVSAKPLYMLSGKGSLQVILNRYIYGVHHKSMHGRKLRWRCIDYRHKHCPAYIDTIDERVISRKFAHKHPLHDEKICQRGSRKKVYESLREARRAMEEETSD